MKSPPVVLSAERRLGQIQTKPRHSRQGQECDGFPTSRRMARFHPNRVRNGASQACRRQCRHRHGLRPFLHAFRRHVLRAVRRTQEGAEEARPDAEVREKLAQNRRPRLQGFISISPLSVVISSKRSRWKSARATQRYSERT